MSTIKVATIYVTLFIAISTVLGFFRESYIAYAFGASGLTDAYYIASVIPEMVAGLLANALMNALVPVLKAERRSSRKSARHLSTVVFWDAAIVLVALTIIAYICRGYIVHLIAPGFRAVEYAATMHMLAIMSLAILFSGLSGVLWGIHNSYDQFYFPAVVGITYNISLLVSTIILQRFIGIDALAVGFLVGVIGRFLIQLIPLVLSGKIKMPKHIWHPSIREVVRLMPPVFLSSGLGSINLMVDRVLASSLPTGQISDMNFATKIGRLPSTIVGNSLATTLYARFVTYTLDRNQQKLRSVVEQGVTFVIFLSVAVGGAFILFSSNVVSILFQHGRFSSVDVSWTSGPLRLYGAFTVFSLLNPILTRFFFARKENKFVLRVSIISVIVNIAGSLLWIHSLGVQGLVLANGVSQVVLVALMSRRLVKRLYVHRWNTAVRVIVAGMSPGISFLAGAAFIAFFWRIHGHENSILQCARGACAIGISLFTLAIFSLFYKTNLVSEVYRAGLYKCIGRFTKSYSHST